MKIDVIENGIIRIKELLKPFVLENDEGIQLALAMKDDGYELLIGGIWYKANEHGIVPMKQTNADEPINVQSPDKQVLASMEVELSLKDIKPKLPKPVIDLDYPSL